MAPRNHITVFAVALAAMLCTVQVAYSQGPKKTTEELQYVPPPARVVHDSVTGTDLIKTGTPSRYATVELTPQIDYDFCGMGCISKVIGRIGLNLEGASTQFDLGADNLEIDVTVEVQYYDGSTWDPLGSAIVFKLHVDNSSTPKKYRIHQEVVVDLLDYRGNKCGTYPSYVYDDLRLRVTAYNDHSAAAGITDSLKLYFRLEEYTRIHPSSVEADGCSDGETMVKLLAPTADLATNPVTLSWENRTSAGIGSACDEAYPWYEVQVLRLYNTDADYRNDPAKLKAVVNWSEAQRFILYGQATSMTFTLADGTGYYLWRVRPIGNWHEGGFGNDTNWGCWTPHPADGATINLSLTNSTPQAQVTAWRNSHSGAVIARSLFHYNQFDEDKNWIFNRTFMEGRDGRNGGYEGITYATGLLQPIQTQAASQTTGQVMVSHTVLDANGRPTLSVLPFIRSGVDNGKLEFLEGAALYGSAPYTWKDFDDASITAITNPHVMSGAAKVYWDDGSDLQMPSSQQYPFTRTLLSNDPLARPVRQGAAGGVMRIGGKDVQTLYAPVSDVELVSVFGREAPRLDQTSKVVTIDQNGVTSVRYELRDGRVVATALVDDGDTNNLMRVHDGTIDDLTLVDTVRYGTNLSDYEVMGTRDFVLEKETTVDLAYWGENNTFEQTCANICSHCDRIVTLEVVSMPDGNVVWPTSGVISTFFGPATACTAAQIKTLPATGEPYQATLPAGMYQLRRKLMRPSASPVLKTHSDNIMADLKTKTDVLLRRLFTTAANPTDLTNFLFGDPAQAETYARRMLKQYEHFRDSLFAAEEVYVVPIDDCIEVELGPSQCPTGCGNASNPALPDYEAMLRDRWRDSLLLYNAGIDTTRLSNYVYNYAGDLVLEGTGTDTYGAGVINGLLERMISEGGYSCEDVYACWSSVVEGMWLSGFRVTGGSTPVLEHRTGYDLLHEFLDCVGTKYCSLVDYDEKETDEEWLKYAWKKLPRPESPTYDTEIADCETLHGYNAASADWQCNGTNPHDAEVNDRYRALRDCFVSKVRYAIDGNDDGGALDSAKSNSLSESERNPYVGKLDSLRGDDPVTTQRKMREFFEQQAEYCREKMNRYARRLRDSLARAYVRGGSVVEGFPDLIPEGEPLDTVKRWQFACHFNSLLAATKNMCDLPDVVFHPDSAGYAASQLAIERMMKINASIAMNIKLAEGDTCLPGWERAEAQVPLVDVVVTYLNELLSIYRDTVGVSISRWNLAPIFTEMATHWPELLDCLPPADSFSHPADVHPNGVHPLSRFQVIVNLKHDSYFTVVRDTVDSVPSCRIVYIPPPADNQTAYTPDNPHPLVTILNEYIRQSWGKEADIDDINPTNFNSQAPSGRTYTYYHRTGGSMFAVSDDPLKPAFACDENGIPHIGPGVPQLESWEYCPDEVECVYGATTSLSALATILKTHSTTSFFKHETPTEDAIRIYGTLQFNICGYNFRRNLYIDDDTLFVGTSSVFGGGNPIAGRPIDVSNSEWDLWSTGDDFLKNIGQFTMTEDGYLAFFDAIRDTLVVFECLRFDCPPAIPDSCNIVELCTTCDSVSCGVACIQWQSPAPLPSGRRIPTISCKILEVQRLMKVIEMQIMQREAEKRLKELEISYKTNCFDADNINDRFTVSRSMNLYHHTLYYYDRAGNLVQTVPPAGVQVLPLANRTRANATSHTKKTQYEYNTLKQLVKQTTPDAGVTTFYYNNVGQLRLSQNARQGSGVYSYTNYDDLGRIIEVGQVSGITGSAQDYVNSNPQVNSTSGGVSSYVTKTTYTEPEYQMPQPWQDSHTQRHTRNRITKTLTDVDGNLTTIEDQVVTYYSYDPHGNVEWLVQSLPDGSTQRQNFLVEYNYDLISGKVTEVRFQPNREDQFTHRYTYDRDNRLSAVHTSHDGVLWERDAEYEYYPHGPLRRISMGRDSVQGIDYTYTINGWLKGINLPTLDKDKEPGRDNDDDGPNTHHGRDAFGMMLNYHIGDFHKPERTGTGAHPESPFHFAAQPSNMTLQSLYNGNIAGWMWNSRDNTGAMQTRLGSVYRYDQLNRLRVDSVHTWNGTNAWVPGSKWLNYYSYDADGNIKTLYRNDDGGNGLDNLQYHYITGKPNQLRRVQEHMAATAYTGDLEDQTETDNYAYDATGNLTQDVSENIQTGGISWTPYNKIDRIVKVTGGTPTMKLAYLYDASGNRVIKDHYATDTSSSPTRTYYIRDAQGNVMGIFKRASGETYAERQETPIYGSSRLGVSYKGALHTAVATDTLAHYNTLYTRELRQRGYELTDHLGNVRATVSDMLIPRGSGVFDADLRTLTDYYPFGMTMPERSYEAAGINSHRYGYNGKENDNEVKGEGNSLDYGARIYDPRVGRWLSVDPLSNKFPHISPYVSSNVNPVYWLDPDGRENIPALLWALKNMVNKNIVSNYSDPYLGGSDNRWKYQIGVVPPRAVCYESCFMAYLNSGPDVVKTLQSGFTNRHNAFFGRSTTKGGMNWFKAGNGVDRTFETDIAKGELGDIVFMGESAGMEGHAVLLASPVTITTSTIDGVESETATFYALSTSSETQIENYGGRTFQFRKLQNGLWQDTGSAHIFRGFGQMKNVNASSEQRQEAEAMVDELRGNSQENEAGSP